MATPSVLHSSCWIPCAVARLPAFSSSSSTGSSRTSTSTRHRETHNMGAQSNCFGSRIHVESRSRAPALRPTLLRAAAAAAVQHTQPDFDRSVYLDASSQPPHFVGPIVVANIPGKGRGLVASEPLRPGQLLLAVPALAFVEGGLGEIPEHDELVEVLCCSGALFSPWQAAWLKALTTSTQQEHTDTNSSSSSSSQQQSRPVVPDFLPPAGQAAWLGADAAAAAGRVPFEALGMDEEQLWAATVLNCYGEGFPDLPASLCASAPLNGHIGLWGPFSLINHACCPNAVNYTLRDAVMVVRCCAPVPAGGEVVINYLGRSVLGPLAQRQAELEACYGFSCDCKRCRAEAAWAGVSTASGGSLTSFLDQLHSRIGEEFEPRRAQIAEVQQAAVEHKARGADSSSEGQQQGQHQQQQQEEELRQLVAHMQQQWVELMEAAQGRAEEAAGRHMNNNNNNSVTTSNSSSSSSCGDSSPAGLSQHPQSAEPVGASEAPAQQSSTLPAQAGGGEGALEEAWVLASGFDLLGLLHDACEALGEPHEAVLGAIVRVCEAVCPGSDLHVFQALRRTSIAQRQQQQQQQQEQDHGDGGACYSADEAMQSLVRALQMRYGMQVGFQDKELLERMVAASSAAADMVWL